MWLFSTLSIHGWKPFNNKFLEMFTRITSHTRSESLFCRWLRQWISSGWQKLSFCVFWFVLNRFETIWRALDQSGDRKTEEKLSFWSTFSKNWEFVSKISVFFQKKLSFSPYVEVKKPSVRKTSFFTRKKYPWRPLLVNSPSPQPHFFFWQQANINFGNKNGSLLRSSETKPIGYLEATINDSQWVNASKCGMAHSRCSF